MPNKVCVEILERYESVRHSTQYRSVSPDRPNYKRRERAYNFKSVEVFAANQEATWKINGVWFWWVIACFRMP